MYQLWMTGQNPQAVTGFFAGLGAMSNANAPVDMAAVMRAAGFPVTDAREGKLYEYHFKYGLLTVNEGREFLGLPPVKGGDTVVKDQTVKEQP